MTRSALDRQLKLAQQTQERTERRKRDWDFLVVHGYEQNE